MVELAATLFVALVLMWGLNQLVAASQHRAEEKAQDARDLMELARALEAEECWCGHTKEHHRTTSHDLAYRSKRARFACTEPGCPCKDWHTEANFEERAYLRAKTDSVRAGEPTRNDHAGSGEGNANPTSLPGAGADKSTWR